MSTEPNNAERFTLSQAAKVLGVSVPTARRLVTSNRLPAIKVMVGDRMRWEIERSEVFRLKREGFTCVARDASEAAAELGELDFTNASEVASKDASSVKASPGIPLAAHLAALGMAEKQIHWLQNEVSDARDELANERRRAEQAERARLALEWQLHQYQTALAESAESLAEAQALRKVAEARLEEPAPVQAMTEAPAVPLESLKTGKPEREGWGRRVRRWFGFKQAQ